MIQIDEMTFDYGSSGFRLTVRSLRIAAGEKVAIVGPSGSGKSTLLRLIAGAAIPNKGSIRIGQTRVDQLNDAERRNFRISQIGFVFQEFELIEYLSVRENIRLPYLIHRSQRWNSAAMGRLQSLTIASGLSELLHRYPDQLSQGERQRVAICRALVAQPQLILADEPTGSLDSKMGSEILDLLINQANDENATLLMVTHDVSFSSRMDRSIDMTKLHQVVGRSGDG